MALGSAVPLKAGLASLVVLPLAISPATGFTSSVAVKAGASGAAVSSVKLPVPGVLWPAASVLVR